MRYITTNNLAKELDLTRNELFDKLRKLKLITTAHELTRTGKKNGGEYKEYKGHKYISWKDRDKIISLIKPKKSFFGKVLDVVDETIATIGEKPQVPKKTPKPKPSPKKSPLKNADPRKLYKAPEIRTDDGHYVRSKAEAIIDNWFYSKGLVHAYEKRLPIEENLLSDFYLPQGQVYIEYWGYENTKYLDRKATKQKLYRKYGFNLIELIDSDVQKLDDVLPRMLLKFGVKIF